MRLDLAPVSFALLLVLASCDDPLLEAQRIENTRVLGARVEVAGDVTRARPRPGESVAVTWLVADPRPNPALGWDFAVCVGENTLRGVPGCLAAPFLKARSEGVSPSPPLLSFTLPGEPAFEASDRVVVLGAICADAPVELVEPIEQTRCGTDLTLVALDIRLEREGAANRNPSLTDEALSFDGAPWPTPSSDLLSRQSCVADQQTPELPLVSANGQNHRFRIGLSPDDREPLATIEGERTETLQLSHFATLGRLDRPLSVIEPAAPETVVEVDWEAPGPGLASSQIGRFYFVARDLRGGTDWVIRTACIVP